MTRIIVKGKNGKVWGMIILQTYYTTRNEEHYCFKYKGYGIQKSLYDELVLAGIQTISIQTEDNVFLSYIEAWKKFGVIDTLRKQDGEQIFLPKEYMIDTQARDKNKKLDEFL